MIIIEVSRTVIPSPPAPCPVGRSCSSSWPRGHHDTTHGKCQQSARESTGPAIQSTLHTSVTWSAAATSRKLQSKSLAKISPRIPTGSSSTKWRSQCYLPLTRLVLDEPCLPCFQAEPAVPLYSDYFSHPIRVEPIIIIVSAETAYCPPGKYSKLASRN